MPRSCCSPKTPLIQIVQLQTDWTSTSAFNFVYHLAVVTFFPEILAEVGINGFDESIRQTFTNPNLLPPGTPLFQHIEPTGFKQVL
jgi:hypothetical protein